MEDDRQLQEYKVPKVIHCHCKTIHEAEIDSSTVWSLQHLHAR